MRRRRAPFSTRPSRCCRSSSGLRSLWQAAKSAPATRSRARRRRCARRSHWIPNADLDYDSWVRIGMAIKGAIGEAGADLFAAWSAQSAKNDAAVTAKTWAGFKPERIGAGTLYHHAHRARLEAGSRRWCSMARRRAMRCIRRQGCWRRCRAIRTRRCRPVLSLCCRRSLRSTVSMACSAAWSSISWRPPYVPSHGSRWARRSRCWAR